MTQSAVPAVHQRFKVTDALTATAAASQTVCINLRCAAQMTRHQFDLPGRRNRLNLRGQTESSRSLAERRGHRVPSP